jgi:hypothetical protein
MLYEDVTAQTFRSGAMSEVLVFVSRSLDRAKVGRFLIMVCCPNRISRHSVTGYNVDICIEQTDRCTLLVNKLHEFSDDFLEIISL